MLPFYKTQIQAVNHALLRLDDTVTSNENNQTLAKWSFVTIFTESPGQEQTKNKHGLMTALAMKSEILNPDYRAAASTNVQITTISPTVIYRPSNPWVKFNKYNIDINAYPVHPPFPTIKSFPFKYPTARYYHALKLKITSL